jgi:phosphatidylglycerophosphatase A
MPIAPGSFGALLGVAMHLAVVWWLPPQYWLWALLACFVVVCAAHFALNDWAQRYWNDPDSGHFVLDEVAGYLVVPVLFALLAFCFMGGDFESEGFIREGLPWYEALMFWWVAPVGFSLFRIFDIIKLPGARYIDRNWHNAWGVLLDDIISGVYATVVVVLGVFGAEHWFKIIAFVVKFFDGSGQ